MGMPLKTIVLGITGASGAVYGWDLLHKLEAHPGVRKVYLILSRSGREVMATETGIHLDGPQSLERQQIAKAVWLAEDDLFAPVASGSHPVDAMIIAPCTMSTIGCLAAATGRNLIHRAGDVTLKEGRPLVLVPRETPLHAIHLENLLRLARAGARIVPAMPSFYLKPKSIQELVATVTIRVLEICGLPTPGASRWEGRP